MVLGKGRDKCYNVVAHCKVKSFIEKERFISCFQVKEFFLDRGKILMILFFTFGSNWCTLTPFSTLLFCFFCLIWFLIHMFRFGNLKFFFSVFVFSFLLSPSTLVFFFSRLRSHWGNFLGQNFVNSVPVKVENLRMNYTHEYYSMRFFFFPVYLCTGSYCSWKVWKSLSWLWAMDCKLCLPKVTSIQKNPLWSWLPSLKVSPFPAATLGCWVKPGVPVITGTGAVLSSFSLQMWPPWFRYFVI